MAAYRWEYDEIGQGHYGDDEQKMRREAFKASQLRPDLQVTLEVLSECERYVIGMYKAGRDLVKSSRVQDVS
jgi:hypothetical protein